MKIIFLIELKTMLNLNVMNEGLNGVLTPSEFMTLYVINNGIDGNNNWKRIYLEMLEDLTGISTRQLKRIIISLEEKGFIEKNTKQITKTKRVSEYRINEDKLNNKSNTLMDKKDTKLEENLSQMSHLKEYKELKEINNINKINNNIILKEKENNIIDNIIKEKEVEDKNTISFENEKGLSFELKNEIEKETIETKIGDSSTLIEEKTLEKDIKIDTNAFKEPTRAEDPQDGQLYQLDTESPTEAQETALEAFLQDTNASEDAKKAVNHIVSTFSNFEDSIEECTSVDGCRALKNAIKEKVKMFSTSSLEGIPYEVCTQLDSMVKGLLEKENEREGVLKLRAAYGYVSK